MVSRASASLLRAPAPALPAAVLALLALAACSVTRARLVVERPPRPAWSAAQLAQAVTLSEVAVGPSGEIAFVSDRSGVPELWMIPVEGGAPRRPEQRTRLGEPVSGLAFGADGSLVFQADRGGEERRDLWLLRPGAAEAEPLARTPLSEQDARFSPDAKRLAFVADPERPFRFQLMVRDLAGGDPRRITREEVDVLGPRWSRDGQTLVVTRTGDGRRGELLAVDVQTGRSRSVAPPVKDGILWAAGFLPDGRLVGRATNAAGFLQLAAVELEAGGLRLVGPGDADVEDARVAEDGRVFTLRNVGGESEIAVAAAPDERPRPLLGGGLVASLDADAGGRVVVAVRESSSRPAELLVLDPESGRAIVVVPADGGPVRLRELAQALPLVVPSVGGRLVQGWLWRPPVRRLGSPPPCVVVARGGPGGQARPGFSSEVQALAEAGFLVAAPDLRASGGVLEDILAWVDELASRGEIDRSRVGVTGEGHRGHLALRAIAAAPQRLAAVPLLVLQGAGDPDVPRAESDTLVAALRGRGAAVEHVVYPDEGHGLKRRANRTDAATRTVEFFARHLGAAAAP